MTLDEQFAIFLARDPTIDPTAYLAPGATLIGDVRVAAQASVWPGSVLRGDINFIEIGESTNVQDGTIIHLSDDYPVRDSIIGAQALVTQEMIVPPGSLVLGVPGKITRTLSAEEQAAIRGWAEKYIKVADAHRAKRRS